MAKLKHYSHIDFETRINIENYLAERRTLAYMSCELGVDATSISRELKRNRRSDGVKKALFLKNKCAHRTACSKRKLCTQDCRRKCSLCSALCKEGGCSDFEEEICWRTSKAPWVCNGCERRPTCPLERFVYSAKLAQAKADSRLSESREGLDMTGAEMKFLAEVVKEGLAKGQSVHHIFVSRDDLPCSERSFYRHVENEAIDVHKMDLRKKVKYKKRSKKRVYRELGFFEGHTYADYKNLSQQKRIGAVQMDCVEGAEEDTQAILTLHFVALRFQIYLLLKKKDSAHVVAALNWLEKLCGGPEAFKEVFGCILADRGSEFSDIEGIEQDGRTNIYFCDPQRPDQKGGCEKNHVELRKVIPKGTSLDGLNLDAWLLAGICSHVNSSLRLAIGNASPMALAQVALPASLLDGLGLKLVPPKDVETRPELIERLRHERKEASV